MNEDIRKLPKNFLGYFERYWLKVVKPDGFSVFGLPQRTNNCSESFNNSLKHTLGHRPVPCEFLRKSINNCHDI